jgi:hypothetical protein
LKVQNYIIIMERMRVINIFGNLFAVAFALPTGDMHGKNPAFDISMETFQV